MQAFKETKLTYKQKDLAFLDGVLTDENGEAVNLEKDLKTIFGDKLFTITAAFQDKEDISEQ